jgi:hypothetical protein
MSPMARSLTDRGTPPGPPLRVPASEPHLAKIRQGPERNARVAAGSHGRGLPAAPCDIVDYIAE